MGGCGCDGAGDVCEGEGGGGAAEKGAGRPLGMGNHSAEQRGYSSSHRAPHRHHAQWRSTWPSDAGGGGSGGGAGAGTSPVRAPPLPRARLAAALLSLALLSLCLSAHVLHESPAVVGYEPAVAAVVLTAPADGRAGVGSVVSDAAGTDAAAVIRAAVAAATARAAGEDDGGGGDGRPLVVAAAAARARVAAVPRLARRLPQAIIVGVRKCGTRALLEMLALHPRVQKAAGEVHFFDRDDNYARGLEWYRRRMPHSFPDQITVEKSPSYFVTPEVPERIHAMNASVRLLLIVREPVTRAISDYTQLRSHAATAATAQLAAAAQHVAGAGAGRGQPPPPPPPQPPRTFEQLALRPDGSVNTAYRPLVISMYHTYLHRWLEVFQRQQLLVVNGDALIADPLPELRRIERFLGLEPRLGPGNFYFNRTKGFYCLRNATNGDGDAGGKCLRDSKGRRHPRVDPGVVSKLRRFFAEHNQRLYELLGQDLGWPEE